MKTASAGTFESNDCLITVKRQKGLKIEIHSIVYEQFCNQIKKVLLETLDELNISDLFISINDKGALDYAIKARLITAIERLGE